jgi:hypothetical protein
MIHYNQSNKNPFSIKLKKIQKRTFVIKMTQIKNNLTKDYKNHKRTQKYCMLSSQKHIVKENK